MQCLIDQQDVCMRSYILDTQNTVRCLTTETVGLVGPVHTVAVPVTHPLVGDTGPITAVELRGATTRLTSGGEAETFHVIGYYSHCYTDNCCIHTLPKHTISKFLISL